MAHFVLLIKLGGHGVKRLRKGFLREGFEVAVAYDIDQMRAMSAMARHQVVVVAATAALLPPCLDALADEHRRLPCLVLADLTAAEEIYALTVGATACLAPETPFAEVLARVRGMTKVATGFPVHYRIHDLGIDPVQRRASRAGTPLHLRSGEFDALLALAERQGQLVSHRDLHHLLWPERPFSKKRVALRIHQLRRAIGDDRRTQILHTLRDRGYVLAARRPESEKSRCAA